MAGSHRAKARPYPPVLSPSESVTDGIIPTLLRARSAAHAAASGYRAIHGSESG